MLSGKSFKTVHEGHNTHMLAAMRHKRRIEAIPETERTPEDRRIQADALEGTSAIVTVADVQEVKRAADVPQAPAPAAQEKAEAVKEKMKKGAKSGSKKKA